MDALPVKDPVCLLCVYATPGPECCCTEPGSVLISWTPQTPPCMRRPLIPEVQRRKFTRVS